MARKSTKSSTTATKPTPTVKKRTTTTAAAPKAKAPRGRANGAKSAKVEIVAISHEQIAARAYQLFVTTGRTDEQANWVEAERQLKAEAGVA